MKIKEIVSTCWTLAKNKFSSPKNLLDNSDFRANHHIAQEGLNKQHGVNRYVCDRWITWSQDATFYDEYVVPNTPIDQRFYLSGTEAQKTHTVVLYLADGTKIIYFGKPANGFGLYTTVYCSVNDAVSQRYFVRIGSGQSVSYVALYEGSYTTEAAPEYIPKDYATELEACKWHWGVCRK